MSFAKGILDDIIINDKIDFKEYNYPLHIEFKIGTLANDFSVTDNSGTTVAFVRQKILKLKADIEVFENENKSNLLYTIKGDKIIGFNMNFSFYNQDGEAIGRVSRASIRSIWKANYIVFGSNGEQDFTITELNPWAKVMDSFLGEVPLLSVLTGYLFNPKYGLKNKQGEIIAKAIKEPSFFGRRFKLEQIGEMENGQAEQIMLAFIMMLLSERRRG